MVKIGLKHDFRCKVYYEDTDAGGVVYYANYLKFIERARTEMVSELGINQVKLAEEGIFFVVRKVEINYHLPAKLGDELAISTEITDVRNTYMIMHQEVWCKEQKLITAEVKIACVEKKIDGSFKPRRIGKIGC
jgi:tol-pal system-associated acyl-CoA thioesterase